MERSQWYVGVPNGVVLCVDHVREGDPCGRLYHSYSKKASEFFNMDEIVFRMDCLYDYLNYPYPGTKLMKDEELLGMHGDLGTFIVRVQHRQNSSWQGRITWMEENQTLSFRSIWEMVKLIASAVDTAEIEEKPEEEPSWF